jgi:hypothetical protein
VVPISSPQPQIFATARMTEPTVHFWSAPVVSFASARRTFAATSPIVTPFGSSGSMYCRAVSFVAISTGRFVSFTSFGLCDCVAIAVVAMFYVLCAKRRLRVRYLSWLHARQARSRAPSLRVQM